MSKLRNPNLPPAKKLTKEVMRANPILGALARQRLAEQRSLAKSKHESELDLVKNPK